MRARGLGPKRGRNPVDALQPLDRPDGGHGRGPRQKLGAGSPNVVYRDGVDARDDLLDWYHPPPGQQLARVALDSASRRLERRKQGNLELRLGAGDLGAIDVAGRMTGAA